MRRRWIACCAAMVVSQAALAQAPWVRHVIGGGSQDTWGADGARLGDINGDGFPDVVVGFESSAVTRVFLNPGPGPDVTRPWRNVAVGETPNVEDALFVDLDGDGRLDVVSSDESGKNRNPKGQIRTHFSPTTGNLLDPDNWITHAVPAAANVSEWMYAEAIQIDGRDGLDLVIGGKYHDLTNAQPPLAHLGWLRYAGTNPRTDPGGWEYFKIDDVGWVMDIKARDMDGDGDLDVLVSERRGTDRGVRWLENPAINPKGASLTDPWRRHLIGEPGLEPGFVEVADLDGDQLDDVIVPTVDSRLFWYRRLDATGDNWRRYEIAWPATFGQGKSVAAADVNRDGRIDLVLSSKSLHTDEPGLVWLEHDGDPTADRWTRHDLSGPNSYGKFDLVVMIDLDGDGDLDVLTTEEGRDQYGFGVIWYENPSPPPTVAAP